MEIKYFISLQLLYSGTDWDFSWCFWNS